MSTKHSPGPWSVDPESGQYQPSVVDSKALNVATVSVTATNAESAANARLIAAAPEMLAVLRDVSALLPCAGRMHPKDLHALQTRVCDAIAKAVQS